jgi:hypothetical protein
VPAGHNVRLTRREVLSRLGRLRQVAVCVSSCSATGPNAEFASWGTGREPDSTRERRELAFLELGGARRYDLEIGLGGVAAIERFAAPVDPVSRRSALQVGGSGNG